MFKKKTKEQQIELRVNEVFTQLLKHYEEGFSTKEFTELETVQILNNVKLKLGEYLISKQNDCLQKSKQYDEKADEIKNALNAIE